MSSTGRVPAQMCWENCSSPHVGSTSLPACLSGWESHSSQCACPHVSAGWVGLGKPLVPMMYLSIHQRWLGWVGNVVCLACGVLWLLGNKPGMVEGICYAGFHGGTGAGRKGLLACI